MGGVGGYLEVVGHVGPSRPQCGMRATFHNDNNNDVNREEKDDLHVEKIGIEGRTLGISVVLLSFKARLQLKTLHKNPNVSH